MVRRRSTIWLVILTGIMLVRPAAAREENDTDTKRAYRAAFVLKFIKFTQWPPDVFENDSDPIVVCVVGDEVAFHLDKLVQGTVVRGRPIVVRRLHPPRQGAEEEQRTAFTDELKRSHVLYIDTEHGDRVAELLGAVAGADVLTISGAQGFVRRGGMLGLSLERGRYVFEANPAAIGRTRVKVSSQVLELAKAARKRA